MKERRFHQKLMREKTTDLISYRSNHRKNKHNNTIIKLDRRKGGGELNPIIMGSNR